MERQAPPRAPSQPTENPTKVFLIVPAERRPRHRPLLPTNAECPQTLLNEPDAFLDAALGACHCQPSRKSGDRCYRRARHCRRMACSNTCPRVYRPSSTPARLCVCFLSSSSLSTLSPPRNLLSPFRHLGFPSRQRWSCRPKRVDSVALTAHALEAGPAEDEAFRWDSADSSVPMAHNCVGGGAFAGCEPR